MKLSKQEDKSAGFALIEMVLILVILTAIVGVGVYVMRQKQNANSTLSSNGSALRTKAQPGTAASIEQLTAQDAQTEAGVDSSADNQTQQDATSANTAVSNVGGAYDEASL